MRKLIETETQNDVECDNPNCDFVVPSKTGKPSDCIEYLNKPCPKCGENLLTYEDYIQHARLLKAVDWLNKWFSWITIFYSKKAKTTDVSVKVHKGVKIEKI